MSTDIARRGPSALAELFIGTW